MQSINQYMKQIFERLNVKLDFSVRSLDVSTGLPHDDVARYNLENYIFF